MFHIFPRPEAPTHVSGRDVRCFSSWLMPALKLCEGRRKLYLLSVHLGSLLPACSRCSAVKVVNARDCCCCTCCVAVFGRTGSCAARNTTRIVPPPKEHPAHSASPPNRSDPDDQLGTAHQHSMASRNQRRGGGITLGLMAQERISAKKPASMQLPPPTSAEILAAAAYVPQGMRPKLKARDSDMSEITAAATPSPHQPGDSTRGFSRPLRLDQVWFLTFLNVYLVSLSHSYHSRHARASLPRYCEASVHPVARQSSTREG